MREIDSSLNKKVKRRDKYCCRMCNKKKPSRGLEVHHIFRWADSPGMRFDIENLISLCKACHKSIKNKESYYISYFLNILENDKKR